MDEAKGKKERKPLWDKERLDWIADKAKKEDILEKSGQAVFRDFSRDITVCWTVTL